MSITKHPRAHRGFSMVELLITMFILAIGLLGLATLQLVSQAQGLGGRQRGTANFVAHNLLDQIQAEGSLTAAERAASTDGIVSLNGRAFVYVDPVGATNLGATVAGPNYTILGLLTDDPYYLANPTVDKTVVYRTTWLRDLGNINSYAKSGVQEFIVNVTWTEINNATKASITKSVSVSRYVRI